MDPKKMTLLDDLGQPHGYLIVPHPASEGLRLASRLFALIGAPFGRIVDAVVAGGEDAEFNIGGASGELAQAVLSADLPQLVKDLLRHVSRDGVDLGNAVMIDVAYSANYGELAEALAEVVEVNGFVRFFSRLGKRAGKGLGGLVQQLSPGRPKNSAD